MWCQVFALVDGYKVAISPHLLRKENEYSMPVRQKPCDF